MDENLEYFQLEIITAGQPLTINDFYGIFTSYPFTLKATFESSDPGLKAIWNTGWNTARLCANETYMDCPYYEQLQYLGDTRIQALISLYLTGDDRLMKNALKLANEPRTPKVLPLHADLPIFHRLTAFFTLLDRYAA